MAKTRFSNRQLKRKSIQIQRRQHDGDSLADGNEMTGDDIYASFYNKQSKEQQEKLPPPLSSDGKVESSYIFEVAENHQAFAFRESNNFDDPPPEPKRIFDQDEVEVIIRRVVMAMQLSETPEVLFQARCILIAFGIGDPPTETELARIKGCSRQFVSKKVKRIQQLFDLTPSQYMRSENACKAYAEAWKKAHGGGSGINKQSQSEQQYNSSQEE